MRLWCVFLALCLVACPVVAQESPKKPDVVEELSNNRFRATLLKAADSAARKGEIRRLDVVRLRVASLSPAFVARAQELAVLQMSASGDDLGDLPIGDDGKIEVNRIDWENLLAFIERLIPLILRLIDLFSMNGGSVYYGIC